MTTLPAGHGAPAPDQALQTKPAGHSRDRRGSPIPTAGMIATRVMELRKRRGLMIALIVVNIGLPALFLLIRLLLHAFAPRTNPPAGSEHDLRGPGSRLAAIPSASSSRPRWAVRRDRATSPKECSGTWS